MPALTIVRAATAVSLAALTGSGVFMGYKLVRAELASDIYRERLGGVAQAYADLAASYNRAVARTAVTELVVEGDTLAVRIRNDAGEITEIPTPYNPRGEIYVDYALINGRLWMRRVFDDATPPRQGLVINPDLAQIDWESEHAEFGKAVYRSLPEGRWVVSVTGAGSLGLVRVKGNAPTPLAPPPAVGEFETVEEDAARRASDIGLGDVLSRVFGG